MAAAIFSASISILAVSNRPQSNTTKKLTNCRLRVTRRKERESTSIDNTQSLHTIHTSLRVNNSHLILRSTHLASASRMPNSHDIVLDPFQDLSISLDLSTGVVLITNDNGCHGIALEGLAHAFEHGNGNLLVCWGVQPVGVNCGRL